MDIGRSVLNHLFIPICDPPSARLCSRAQPFISFSIWLHPIVRILFDPLRLSLFICFGWSVGLLLWPLGRGLCSERMPFASSVELLLLAIFEVEANVGVDDSS